MAEVLIAAGADLNAKDQVRVPSAPRAAVDSVLVDGQIGRTPLHKAASTDRCEMAKVLIAAGADLNAKDQVRVLYALSQLLIVCAGGWTAWVHPSALRSRPRSVRSR